MQMQKKKKVASLQNALIEGINEKKKTTWIIEELNALLHHSNLIVAYRVWYAINRQRVDQHRRSMLVFVPKRLKSFSFFMW